MDNVRWLDEREMKVWRGYLKMSHRLENAVSQQLLHDAGLSGADYALLVPLSESPDHRLRAIELRRCVDWEKSRLSHQIRRMEQRGLIKRVECPSDARSTFITLTEAGLRAIQAAAPDHLATVRRHFIDLLSPEELEVFGSIIDRVLQSLSRCPTESSEPPMDSAAQGAVELQNAGGDVDCPEAAASEPADPAILLSTDRPPLSTDHPTLSGDRPTPTPDGTAYPR